MEVLWIAIPAALLIVLVAIAAFLWAVRSGQMDDLETPAMRMLHDDEPVAREDASRPRAAPDPARGSTPAAPGAEDEADGGRDA